MGCAAARPAGREFYNGKEVAAGEVLVKFRGTPDQVIGQAVTAENADETEYVGSTQAVRFHSRTKNVETLIRELEARPDVEYVEPNYIVYALETTPNDPRYGDLWGIKKISAPWAWDSTKGSPNYVVAVVDTGIDYTHPDLAANVWTAKNIFSVTVSNGLTGTTITCPAGSHGFNAITNSCDPRDDNNHGTHVSGTIGAVGNNDLGVVGVNWNTQIMALKFLNSQGSGYLSDAVEAIDFGVKLKQLYQTTNGADGANVRVLSNSWGGGGYSQTLFNEIILANQKDILFVAAAGNDGRNNDLTASYPSGYAVDNVVAVAATDSSDTLASWSNYGKTTVDLAAPGVGILSTIRSNSYASYSGTSMATPHVSGAAALVLAGCPPMNTAQLKGYILSSVDTLSSLNGKVFTGGRLNVDRAIDTCSVSSEPDFSISVSPASQTVPPGSPASYSVTINHKGGFTEPVDLRVTGLPFDATFDPPTIIYPDTSSTLKITTGPSTG
ncbi:MAG: S8 family serine peptidase, partial [Methanomicrobiales archaeon]|nr:S8 family serine peptidase [Methanomicrobiales archaeon]